VGGGDEVVDGELVLVQEGVEVRLVEHAGALGLGRDEVEEEAGAEPGVERDPKGRGLALVATMLSLVSESGRREEGMVVPDENPCKP
jgi:hypothetical protein